MPVIHKVTLPLKDGDQQFMLPQGSKIIMVGVQPRQPADIQLWYEHDSAPAEPHYFQIFGTGHPIPETHEYRGSTQMGSFVWHVYERTR